jgi:hypothetical protein
MEAFIGMLFFTRKPFGMVWMLVKMLRPRLRANNA